MTQCTKCNSPMIDNNPFDESEPEWVCEKCGGTEGYTPEVVTMKLNLREFREKAGLSQMGLAKATGLPQTSISYWERGKSVPDVLQAYKIAVACGAVLDDLVTGDYTAIKEA